MQKTEGACLLLLVAAAPSSVGIQASLPSLRASLFPLEWASSRYINFRIPSDYGWGFSEPSWNVPAAASDSHLPASDLSRTEGAGTLE